jgi:UDP-3-O-[3-hydroxymyristoyl] glucosamine N-acyltransferase
MRLSDFFPAKHVLRDGEFSRLDEAASRLPGTFAYCQQLDYLQLAARNANVSCILTKPELAADAGDKPVVVMADPRLEYFRVFRELFYSGSLLPKLEPGMGSGGNIHPSAVVSKRARIGSNVSIGANAVIEDFCDIGDGTIIGPNVVIGAEGMQIVWDESSKPLVVPHAGTVSIGENALILAGAIIARSLYMSASEIGPGCQVGILSTIGHGVRLQERCVVSGNCVIAGRVSVGTDAWIGASCSIAQGLTVGKRAKIKMGSVVVRDVADDEVVSGNFAIPHSLHVKAYLKSRRP